MSQTYLYEGLVEMRYLMLAMLATVTLAVSSDARTDGGPERAVINPQPGAGCLGQRWEAYEVEEPVTMMRTVRKWRLSSYPIDIPGPGPQPEDVVISEPRIQTFEATVDFPPAEVIQDVQTEMYDEAVPQFVPQTVPPLDGGLIQSQNLAPSNVQVGVFRNQNQNCPDGRCEQGPLQNRQRGGILRRILGR